MRVIKKQETKWEEMKRKERCVVQRSGKIINLNRKTISVKLENDFCVT